MNFIKIVLNRLKTVFFMYFHQTQRKQEVPMNFDEAFKSMLAIEQGYANHKNDIGGETFKGISRVYWPNWSGWGQIDKHKPHPLFPGILDVDVSLQEQVKAFYKKEFWDVVGGDKLCSISYAVAHEVFDTAVNMSQKRAIKFLQRALNVLNTKGGWTIYPDLSIDGSVGPVTLNALQKCIEARRLRALVVYMNVMQGYHYLSRAEEDKSQEVFMAGWAKRVNLLEE